MTQTLPWFFGDKESCVVIMNRSDYFKKLQHMTDEGIEHGVYIAAEDKTLQDLKKIPMRKMITF